MSTPVLHVEHITMQFGGVVAVNDLSMDIYPGEIVALILSLIHISEPTRPY